MASLQAFQDFAQVIDRSHNEQSGRELLCNLHRQLESEGKWPDQSLYHCSPYPIFLSQDRISQLTAICGALSAAITNIIERWWSDHDARLWESIPLDAKAKSLLQWLDEPAQHMTRPYHKNLGSWRPDILLEEITSDTGHRELQFKICEINARYFCNGFILGARLDAFLADVVNADLQSAYTSKLPNLYGQAFHADQTLYIIRGNVKGLDIKMLPGYLEGHGVCKVQVITPQDLVLCLPANSSRFPVLKARVPQKSPAGDDNTAQHEMVVIDQAVLEVSQAELLSLPLDMLKALALVCSNDMRTIFLAHDKRMLGIVLQELPSLVSNHNCLTSTQADLLRSSIVPTYLPGSIEMAAVVDEFAAGRQKKDNWLLKPVGGGKGDGIVFGFNVNSDEAWLSKLRQNQERSMDDKENLETALCVLQPYIRQPQFDLMVASGDETEQRLTAKKSMFLVGTAMMYAGQYIGTSVWRANTDPICAVMRGGNWFGAVTESTHVP